MYVRINKIQQAPGMWISHETKEELESSDLRIAGAVSLELKLTNAETRILAQGKVQASVLVECTRCNEDISLPLEIELEEYFVPEDSPEAKVTGIDAFEILTYKEDRIVLDEMLRQNLLAAIPMQLICLEGKCLGMCDQCGTNRNTGICECKDEEIDPRWAPLSDLQKRNSAKPSLN